ncbi:2-C-methyl-D-erythritol 4-phosphate cytidylyltransferase [Candidatus Roizmanbacteria bacterium CG_4_10_14_0_8_um_filter_39_9]|uniref:2-C-methyl-D-erythritol 4-phosphate cytidylyltransferase n=1 Tax=Candidatus Roizmanbacteria bacterium CG_4_10_14_0_8_um_filter_39_9 TaxID=1974829 RepID=A0A2M7QF96_9BACT|nr:MAG: 2-C-methyl-D-erythritol 4-phosphate cytidylyltransferase [Candidatus Roizmanbacteria bacterium CG_4_10_14_0_8_um_filter_39_9]
MNKKISVILTAAGNGSRIGKHKILMLIKGKPLIWYTLKHFSRVKKIDEIIVVAKQEDFKKLHSIAKDVGVSIKTVEGGSERIISEYNGIIASKGDLILAHDGCRPFPPPHVIESVIDAVLKYPAVTVGVHPTTSVKYSTGAYVKKSFVRKNTWLGQTPQGFKREIILNALKRAIKRKYFIPTDDAELVANMGIRVRIVEGDEVNIKVTQPNDVYIAERILEVYKA